MKPRKHQQAAIEYAQTYLASDRRCILQMPTGSGKTLVKSLIALERLKQNQKVVILSPSNTTVSKIYLECKQLGMSPQVEMADYVAPSSAPLVLGTYATAWRRIKKHRASHALLILDECHHVNDSADVNRELVDEFDHCLGVSASPWSGLCEAIFMHKWTYKLSEAIRDGINCPYELEISSAVTRNRCQIVYCPSNMQVHEMSRIFPDSDWVLYDRTDSGTVIAHFRMGRISTMVVNRKLTEGFDLPEVKHVWILRSARSLILNYQMAGRALRPFNGQAAKIHVSTEAAMRTLRRAFEMAG